MEPEKSPASSRLRNSSLSRKSEISQAARFRNLSLRSRSSTARIRVSPRAFSARTRFDPMKPAAPVTAKYMFFQPLSSVRQLGHQFPRMDYRRTELADDDPRRLVGGHNGIVKRQPRAEHCAERCDHGVACAAHIEHLARTRGLVAHSPLFEKGHAVLTQGHAPNLPPNPLPQSHPFFPSPPLSSPTSHPTPHPS